MTQNGAMELRDLSGLSAAVRDAVRIDANGETSWPLRSVAAAINELSASGYVILGTDASVVAGAAGGWCEQTVAGVGVDRTNRAHQCRGL
jgi:hypothetical protein